MTKNSLVLGSFVLGAAAAASVIWLKEPEPPDSAVAQPTTTVATATPGTDGPVSLRLAAIEAQLGRVAGNIQGLAQIQSELKQTQQAMDDRLQTLEDRVTAAMTATDQGLPAAAPEHDPEKEEAEFQQQMRQAMATLTDQLSSQGLDEVWSVEAMDRITQISEAPEHDGSTLGYVDCRETMCNLEARHRDRAAMEQFTRALPIELKWNSTVAIHVVDHPDGTTTSTVFISRDGHDLDY